MQTLKATYDDCMTEIRPLVDDNTKAFGGFDEARTLPIIGGDAESLAVDLPANSPLSAVIPSHLRPGVGTPLRPLCVPFCPALGGGRERKGRSRR